VIGVAVVLFVLALVWTTLIAGLIQIVRKKDREKRSHQERPPLPTRVGMKLLALKIVDARTCVSWRQSSAATGTLGRPGDDSEQDGC